MPASRRSFLTGLAAGCLLPGHCLAASGDARRVASLDYGLANTLLSLGQPPIAVAAADSWSEWVVEPPLPQGVVDLGTDREINMERLTALAPDLILTTPYVQGLRGRLEEVAPVLTYSIYDQDKQPYRKAREATRDLGRKLECREAAAQLLDSTDSFFARLATQDRNRPSGPLLLLRFMDARHVRVYGKGSLFDDIMTQIGLANAWQGSTNAWGFQTVGIEQLAEAAGPETRIFTFEPLPGEVRPTLEESPLWTRLPAVKAGRFSVLPAVLMFGMLPSALRFARILSAHLGEDGHEG
ncbi:ABC transporter substrate-binding protein [Fodinicurvata sediminis]|uniref:ABC transporter substrate-binding protein n=1 Tax=Fodinicurvata sediminis TaxID=1121832 RepID=UPI0003B639CC|nr:ABC transporter substrate-binding protein [Fodinicurvata sediminis]